MRDSSGELSATRSPYMYILLGFLALEAFVLLASFMKAALPFMGPVAGLLTVLGTFVVAFASILGYGALMMSRFGTEPGSGSPIIVGAYGAYIDTGKTPPPPPPGPGAPPPPPAGPGAPPAPAAPQGPPAPAAPPSPPGPPAPDAGAPPPRPSETEGRGGYDKKLEGYDPSSPAAEPPRKDDPDQPSA
jgi:hypothetical protein